MNMMVKGNGSLYLRTDLLANIPLNLELNHNSVLLFCRLLLYPKAIKTWWLVAQTKINLSRQYFKRDHA